MNALNFLVLRIVSSVSIFRIKQKMNIFVTCEGTCVIASIDHQGALTPYCAALNLLHGEKKQPEASNNSFTEAPLALPLKPHPPAPGLLLWGGCLAGHCPAPGGPLCGLCAADLKAADEDTGVSPPRGLGEGARATPACFGSGRDIEALDLPQLLPPAGGNG